MQNQSPNPRRLAALALASLLISPWPALGAEQESEKDEYSPFLDRDYPQRPLWGDTHLHTRFSVDAALTGNTLDPDSAFRFARGEEVVSSTGVRARLVRPLDFLVVSDHAEDLGLALLLSAKDPDIMATDFGKELNRLVQQGELTRAMGVYDSRIMRGETAPIKTDTRHTMWQRITAAAEANNTPGIFSAIIGFEWTSSPAGDNLHRNVIYRDGKSLADRVLPFTAFQSEDPEQLWDWMASYEQETGGRLLAIPHNGNLSNGLMFDDVNHSGAPLDNDYARRRMRWEPIYEVTQIKGDGETHPSLSPRDEFADFESWDIASLASTPKQPGMIAREYAREAFKRGLAYDKKLGVNPFRFGLIGSSDAHTALSTTREDNFFGKLSLEEPTADPLRFDEVLIGYMALDDKTGPVLRHRAASASGLAAVWAKENTRAAIWDAMKRREVYATSGTRIAVRLFAGWDFSARDALRPDYAAIGYDRGVPMGGELVAAPAGKSPTFMIHTLRDANGANLDRIQVIKGWLDAQGDVHERIYDVVVAGGRTIGPDGRCSEPVGNTVDAQHATYDNSIGSATLTAHWRDPEFDPEQLAFYYARVLEIPTPRWTTHDAAFFGLELPGDVPVTLQERAYTSPVWYTP